MNKIFIYISVIQVLAIHDQMVKRFGGSFGIRDIGLVESAVFRCQASLYTGIFDKAAALLQSLLKNHAFVGGSKRTALTSAGIFLFMNGWKLENNHHEEVEFAIHVANENLSLVEIASWLEKHSILLTE